MTDPEAVATVATETPSTRSNTTIATAVGHCHGAAEPSVDVSISLTAAEVSPRSSAEVVSPGTTADESSTIGSGRGFVTVMIKENGGHVSFETNDPRGTVAVLTFEHAGSGETGVTSTTEASGRSE